MMQNMEIMHLDIYCKEYYNVSGPNPNTWSGMNTKSAQVDPAKTAETILFPHNIIILTLMSICRSKTELMVVQFQVPSLKVVSSCGTREAFITSDIHITNPILGFRRENVQPLQHRSHPRVVTNWYQVYKSLPILS